MKKKIFLSAALLFFVLMVMVVAAMAQTPEPTIPTRTSTPGAQTPTSPPPTAVPASPTANNPGNPGNPTPENPPAATQTSTAVAQPVTPAGGFLPTAIPCSNQPTILALNANFVNVRSGPGTEYTTIGRLLYQEVRPIIGRDTAVAWWLIQLGNGQTGWVADEVVLVQGNTIAVPIVPAPLLNGATVTPGAPWQPTTPPPCATPGTATPSPIATAGQTMVVAPLETAADAAYPAATPEPAAQTSVLSAAVTPTETATAIILPTSIAAVPPPTVPSSSAENNVAATDADYSGLLLVGAALLLVAGTAVFVIKRR